MRRGFTVVEALISIVILGAVALGIMGLTTTAARRGDRTAAQAYQAAFLASEFARVTAIPPAENATGTVCDVTSSAPWRYRRCTTVTNVSAELQRVSVVVSMVDSNLLPADSLVLERAANVGALGLGGGGT